LGLQALLVALNLRAQSQLLLLLVIAQVLLQFLLLDLRIGLLLLLHPFLRRVAQQLLVAVRYSDSIRRGGLNSEKQGNSGYKPITTFHQVILQSVMI
jgi:hypothetical protein